MASDDDEGQVFRFEGHVVARDEARRLRRETLEQMVAATEPGGLTRRVQLDFGGPLAFVASRRMVRQLKAVAVRLSPGAQVTAERRLNPRWVEVQHGGPR